MPITAQYNYSKTLNKSPYYCETAKLLKFCSHPFDYITWSVLCKRVYRTKISNVNELKPRIDSEWAAASCMYLTSGVSVYTRFRSCWRHIF